jgi:ketosteroid isomerase-like protein
MLNMKKKLLLAATSICMMMTIAFSQSKDETQVAAAIENLRKAMVDADKSVLEKLTAEKLSYGHSSGKIETKREFVDAIVNGVSDFTSIELSNQTISVSGKTAIVRHLFTATTNDNGKTGNVKINILLVWQKQKGGWKLLARQAVRAA